MKKDERAMEKESAENRNQTRVREVRIEREEQTIVILFLNNEKVNPKVR